ncbi:MAG TPA: hypothetical protein VGG39_07525 [Polyangiaceae bacterium]
MATLSATAAFAIETGAPPSLPPPPPPPLTAAPPGAAGPPAHRLSHAATQPAPVASATVSTSASSSSSSADTGVSSSSSMNSSFDTRFFLAPMLGYLSQDLNLGIGLRAGKTLENHIYIGGTFIYQFGESTGGTVNGINYSASSSGFYVGPEGGYDFDLRPVVLRPYVGLGLFSWTGSSSAAGISASASGSRFVVWPGVTVLWSVPNSSFFIGGDARIVSVPGAAFGLYALGGMHFGT